MLAVTKAARQLLQVAILGVGALLVVDRQISPGSLIAASIVMSRALAPVEQAVATWKQITGYRTRAPPAGGVLRRADAAAAGHGAAGGARASARRGGELHAARGGRARAARGLVRGRAGRGARHPRPVGVGQVEPRAADRRRGAAERGRRAPRRGEHRRLAAGRSSGRMSATCRRSPSSSPGSVRDNIARLGRGSDEAVVRAAEIAGVHEMILRLPKGYRTEVGAGGARLSSGQRQRIALARAVFGAPAPRGARRAERQSRRRRRARARPGGAGAEGGGGDGRRRQPPPGGPGEADKVLRLADGAVERFGPREDVLRDLRRRCISSIASRGAAS